MQTPCPSCQKLLELPESSIGKQAKCPSCEFLFTVAETPPEVASTVSNIGPPNMGSAAGGDGSQQFNPYQPASQVGPAPLAGTVPPGEIVITECRFDAIMSEAYSIFKIRLWPMIGGFAILAAVGIVMQGVLATIQAVMGQGQAALAVNGLANIGTNLVNYYFTIGYARVGIAIARNEPSPLSYLLPPLQVYLQYLGGILVYLALIVVTGGPLVGIALGIAQLMGGGDLFIPFAIAAGFLVLLISMGVFWLFWAFMNCISENRFDFMTAARTSYAITKANKGASVLMILASAGLTLVGYMACCIGVFYTFPLAMTMFAVGYLRMTGQPVSGPQAIQ